MGMHGVAFGADDGPAVSYRIETPTDVLEIVDGDEPRPSRTRAQSGEDTRDE